jgi:DNA topoisomerase IB
MGSIYSFKAGKIDQRINEIYQLLKEVDKNMDDQKLMDLLSEQMALEKVKKMISEKLGRIILR